MTLKEAREKLAAKQKALGEIFEKAKTDKGEYDFDKVAELKGANTTAKLEEIRALEKELNDLYDECVKLADTEDAWKKHQERMKDPRGGGGIVHPPPAKRRKSIGDQLVESEMCKAFKERREVGVVSQLDFGLKELKAIFSISGVDGADPGWEPEVTRLPGFVEMAARPPQLIDILPSGNTTQAAVKYLEETTRTHGAAEKAEGEAFAESAFELEDKIQPVEKVTDSIPVTDEQIEDVAQAQSYLTQRLQFGLRTRLDSQCVNGTGTPPALKGILAHSIQSQAKGADPAPDAFFKAMTLVSTTGRAMPTHHVIHPLAWQSIRLLRTADGVYIWGNPSEAGPERMWGLPIAKNEAIASHTAITGSFLAPWIMLFDRRGVDVQLGYVNDQFIKGRLTIRADLRAVLVVFRPTAFCKVTGL